MNEQTKKMVKMYCPELYRFTQKMEITERGEGWNEERWIESQITYYKRKKRHLSEKGENRNKIIIKKTN